MDSGSLFPPGITVLDRSTLARFEGEAQTLVTSILDSYGARSAEAQCIRQPMTSATKLAESDGHRLYLSCDGKRVTGFLKVGTKHLYTYDRQGKVHEMDPTCALDFYVHDDCQRQGLGLALCRAFLEVSALHVRPATLRFLASTASHATLPFSLKLQAEGLEMRMVAWDKPTASSLALLAKHFGMSRFVHQPNNFAVFDEYYA